MSRLKQHNSECKDRIQNLESQLFETLALNSKYVQLLQENDIILFLKQTSKFAPHYIVLYKIYIRTLPINIDWYLQPL